jgi:hypothetical protein
MQPAAGLALFRNRFERVLRTIAKYARELKIVCSIETGAGRTTLLLSHFRERHEVLAKESKENRSIRTIGGSRISIKKDFL